MVGAVGNSRFTGAEGLAGAAVHGETHEPGAAVHELVSTLVCRGRTPTWGHHRRSASSWLGWRGHAEQLRDG